MQEGGTLCSPYIGVPKAAMERSRVLRAPRKIMSGTKQKETRILVYGCDKLGYGVCNKVLKKDNYSIEFHPDDCAPALHEYDIVILNYGVFGNNDWVLKRIREVWKALEQKRIICFLYFDIPAPSQLPTDKFSPWQEMFESDLMMRYLLQNQICPVRLWTPITGIVSHRSELAPYIDIYGATRNYFVFWGEEEVKFVPLCSVELAHRKHVVGFAYNQRVLCLPFHLPNKTDSSVLYTYGQLANSLLSYLAKVYLEPPQWIKEFQFTPEEKLRTSCRQLTKELETCKTRLGYYEKLKQVLFLGDDPLVDVVIYLFKEVYRLGIEHSERYEEDFFISNDQKKRQILVEVKGLNKNVKRLDVSKTLLHRDTYNLPASFPTLLVANTFMAKTTDLRQKDQPIGASEADYARKNDIVILRTLDLLRAAGMAIDDSTRGETFIESLKTRAGWLRVTDEGW